MRQDQFQANFNRLVQAFNVSKPEEKAEIYFEELEHADGNAFGRAVQKIVREHDRFPSIAQLLEAVRYFQPKNEQKHEECAVCDGTGWVMIYGVAYRGRCKHGGALSGRIKLAPVDAEWIAEERAFQKRASADLYGKPKGPLEPSKPLTRHWWR